MGLRGRQQKTTLADPDLDVHATGRAEHFGPVDPLERRIGIQTQRRSLDLENALGHESSWPRITVTALPPSLTRTTPPRSEAW